MSTEMIHGNGTALAPRPEALPAEPTRHDQRRALMPRDYQEAFAMAGAMAKSGLFAAKSPEQAVVILMTGMELGLAPAQAMRGIYVVQNRPVLSADMMVAICKSARDVCQYFRLVETTDRQATYETQRIGDPEPTRLTFTFEDAQRAGLTNKETWKQYTPQLLCARCSSRLARTVYPDLLLGLYTPEEMETAETAPPAPSREPAKAALPAPELPTPTEALVSERDQKTARLVTLMKPLADRERTWWLDRFEAKFGLRNVKQIGLADTDTAIKAIEEGQWPFEAEFEAKQPAPNATEDDPFADTPDVQPALMAAPEIGPGHAKS